MYTLGYVATNELAPRTLPYWPRRSDGERRHIHIPGTVPFITSAMLVAERRARSGPSSTSSPTASPRRAAPAGVPVTTMRSSVLSRSGSGAAAADPARAGASTTCPATTTGSAPAPATSRCSASPSGRRSAATQTRRSSGRSSEV